MWFCVLVWKYVDPIKLQNKEVLYTCTVENDISVMHVPDYEKHPVTIGTLWQWLYSHSHQCTIDSKEVTLPDMCDVVFAEVPAE